MAAAYTFEDLSGGSIEKISDNPYVDLIVACQNDPVKIQSRYETHRENRIAQQRDKLLATDFQGPVVDEILARIVLENDARADKRNCLVFWARPPTKVRSLIAEIQRRIQTVLPDLWLMPNDCLHMTALEIVHSRTPSEIETLVDQISPAAASIVNITQTHRARLYKPLVGFDAQALALTFLPVVDSSSIDPSGANEDGRGGDLYTYHHLRRDVFDAATKAGIKVASRYVVPSAHLTIGRYITTRDLENDSGQVDHDKVKALIAAIDGINDWLREKFWPDENGQIAEGGEWTIGEEKGLEFRRGTLWYGGGEQVLLGQGF